MDLEKRARERFSTFLIFNISGGAGSILKIRTNLEIGRIRLAIDENDDDREIHRRTD